MQGVGREGTGPGDKPRARELLKGWHLAGCLEEEATQSNRAGNSGDWKAEEPRYRAMCGVQFVLPEGRWRGQSGCRAEGVNRGTGG